ncbi:MAG: Crp/Fnr family transcriptional regulator [Burkholderiales bacterium]|nr:Crp/Fnr family transcriptional regulator [Burkholderiales bacterium]
MSRTAHDDPRVAIARLYPGLSAFFSGPRAAVPLTVTRIAAGMRVFDTGNPCQGFPLILEGGVRVARGTADGRMLELYRVTPGEMCIVSAGCLQSGRPLSAFGETYLDTRLVLLGQEAFMAATAEAEVRRFVFGTFAERMADLCELVEAVAFHRVDRRLAEMLLGHGREIGASHAELAQRLGTSREIVSRLIARFARAGYVESGREHIRITDATALRAVAAGEPPASV